MNIKKEPVVETMVFETVTDDIAIRTTLTYQDKQLLTQKTISLIPYEAMGVKLKVIAKSVLKFVDKQFANINGVTHRFDYGDLEAEELLEIDFRRVSESDLKKIPGEGWLSESDQLVDYETFIKTLLTNGYTEKRS